MVGHGRSLRDIEPEALDRAGGLPALSISKTGLYDLRRPGGSRRSCMAGSRSTASLILRRLLDDPVMAGKPDVDHIVLSNSSAQYHWKRLREALIDRRQWHIGFERMSDARAFSKQFAHAISDPPWEGK